EGRRELAGPGIEQQGRSGPRTERAVSRPGLVGFRLVDVQVALAVPVQYGRIVAAGRAPGRELPLDPGSQVICRDLEGLALPIDGPPQESLRRNRRLHLPEAVRQLRQCEECVLG